MCSTLQAYKTSTMMQHHATCVLYVPLYRKEKQVSMSPAYSSDHAISAEFFLSWHPPGGAKEAMNADDGEGHRVEFTIMVAAGLVRVYHFLLSFLCATR
jgi:hypothetical protein